MKYCFLFLVLALSPVLGVFAQKTFTDTNVEKRDVGSFTAIHVSGAFDVYITQASRPELAVSATSASSLPDISTEVRGGTLHISYKSSVRNWRSNQKLRAYIGVADLNRIEISGACNVYIEGELRQKDMDIQLSGASDFKGKLQATNVKLRSTGSSDFQLSGSAQSIKVSLSGSSDLKAFDFAVDYADIDASGASDVQITVNKEMKVRASGASSVFYKGDAVIREVSTTGASSLKKRS